MLKGNTGPLVLLQESLLGQAASEALTIDGLEAEMQLTCRMMAGPLTRLSRDGQNDSTVSTSAVSLARRMQAPLVALHQWVLAQAVEMPMEVGSEEFEDFVSFVVMARSLAESQGAAQPGRLMHLLGLATVRARLETHIGLTPAIDMPALATAGGLGVVEIAALCGLKLTTVRNAVSRREMVYTRVDGVPLDAALDWMVQRSGFLYAHINAVSWDRRINGRLAANWLANCSEVVFERHVSRLRLSLWHVTRSGRRLALNAEGVRNCVLLLPNIDAAAYRDLGLELMEDRSHDPAAEMHREALMLGPGESLWQCQAPTLRSLDALVILLGRDAPDESTPVVATDQTAAALPRGRLCQAE